MSVLDRSELEASPLADLHAIADQLGLDGFRRLRKAELIDAILGEPGEGPEGADVRGTLASPTGRPRVRPRMVAPSATPRVDRRAAAPPVALANVALLACDAARRSRGDGERLRGRARGIIHRGLHLLSPRDRPRPTPPQRPRAVAAVR